MVLAFLLFMPTISVWAQLPDQFKKVELVTDISNPVHIDFAPDGRIFILDRYGELLVYKPDLQIEVSAGTIPVFHGHEDGLIGIAFDPNFSINQHLYLHYSPPDKSVNRVSRFTMNADQLLLNSEVMLLEWETQRTSCCHAGGDMDFDSKGNLYIATGDNTNHSLYAPLDESNSDLSAEKSSSNTNDLRGKILRITPQPDGSYTVPSDNLFPGGNGGLPEIYVMGARNPFQIFVDKDNTDWLFWGEVGPDANVDGPEGPMGLDEINLTKAAGNYGWPYFSGNNQPYRNNYSNPQFYYDPAAPVNLSQWNTGASTLPPAQPSWLDLFHKSYLAGPRYYFDPAISDSQRLPAQLDGAFFYFDFNTSRIWVVKMDANGTILSDDPFAPAVFPREKFGFIDMKIGPDGHLYILEYGAGCCPYEVYGGKLVRVDYVGETANLPPVVQLTADPTSGPVPLTVNFSSAGTTDPEKDPLTFSWDFQGDGKIDSNQENPSFSYTKAGTYEATLTVNDGNSGITTEKITIYAGNNAATFNFKAPPDGGLMNWGDDIDFEVEVNDSEDGSTSSGSIKCQDVQLTASVFNQGHLYGYQTMNQCQGTSRLDAKSKISINAGGPALVNGDISFGPDQYATGGEPYTNTVAINSTENDALYQTERYGNFTYEIPVHDPGTYLIRLHFAEIYYGVKVSGGHGDRVFNVNIEGNPVLSNFDILNEVAPATALIKEFEVQINDGQGTIELSSIKGDPKIAAIEVINANGFDIYGGDDLHFTLTASYTDKGNLTASQQINLYPKRHEAEYAATENDISKVSNTDPWGGGNAAIRVNHGSYISYTGRNLTGITAVRYRTSSAGTGGKIELRLDGVDGTLISTTDVPASGSWDNWLDQQSTITPDEGKHDLYFVFKNNPGDQNLFDLNYIQFEGAGVSVDRSPPEVLEVRAESATSVIITFSEVVSPNTAESLDNYTIDQGISINSAILAPDSRTVILTTSRLDSDSDYILSVDQVENQAGLVMVAGNYPFTGASGGGPVDAARPRLKLYPNPTSRQVTLEIELLKAENAFIHIHDALGRTFYFKEVFFETGRNMLTLELENFTEGLYYLKVNSRGTNLTGKKLLIQNHQN
jgi:glucose/arabinose dehydrogenase